MTTSPPTRRSAKLLGTALAGAVLLTACEGIGGGPDGFQSVWNSTIWNDGGPATPTLDPVGGCAEADAFGLEDAYLESPGGGLWRDAPLARYRVTVDGVPFGFARDASGVTQNVESDGSVTARPPEDYVPWTWVETSRDVGDPGVVATNRFDTFEDRALLRSVATIANGGDQDWSGVVELATPSLGRDVHVTAAGTDGHQTARLSYGEEEYLADLVHVFGRSDASVPGDVDADICDGQDDVDALIVGLVASDLGVRYELDVPAGQARHVVTFIEMTLPGEPATVDWSGEGTIEALLTDRPGLALADVVNWSLPQQLPPPPAQRTPAPPAPTPPPPDADGDGRPDGSDNCPQVANADQADADGDGTGDVCDGDYLGQVASAFELVRKGGTHATSADQVVIEVTPSVAGPVSILEFGGEPGLDGDEFEFGPRVEISFPTPGNGPTVLSFRLDPSLLPPGVTAHDLSVLHDGDVIPPCTDAAAPAPDPCVVGQGMRGGDVVVTVHSTTASEWGFTADLGGCADGTAFPELGGNVHAGAIRCAVAWGVTEGRTDGSFGAGDDVTRGQMASFLVRLLGSFGVEVPAGSDAFTDDDATTHEAALDSLAALGIVAGEAGTVRPSDALTRAEAAAWLVDTYAAVVGTVPPGQSRYPDVTAADGPAAIGRATGLGFVEGYADGTFRPGDPLRRDQMASVLHRLTRGLLARGAW